MLFIKKKAKEAEMKKMKAVEAEQPKPETVKCPKCGAELDKQRVVKAKYICYECGSYFRVKTKNRIKMVTDPKSFEPWFEDMPMSNPLNTAGYEDKVKAAQEKTGLKEAVTVGKALINGEPAMIGICDARFLMSSMGQEDSDKEIRLQPEKGKNHLYARKHTSGSGDLLVCQTGFDVGKRQKIYRKIFYMVYSEG